MPATAGRLAAVCAAAMLAAGCAQTIQGTAMRAAPGIDDESQSPVDVESVMLDQAQMRAITGAGENLTIVPSMDGKIPVDVSDLMNGTPQECQWYFAETQTFGPEVEEFHKTTFQNPPDGGLISEGAAAYRDPETARHAFADLVGRVYDCGSTELGVDVHRRVDGGRRYAADAVVRHAAAATTGSRTSCWPRCRSVRSPSRCPTSS